MADASEGSSDAQITFKVKTSGDGNHTITISEAATVHDLKTKLSTAEFENIPVERQRLIYSGRVMKNEEPLSTYKIKNGNTVHLVKSAASNPTPHPPSTSSAQIQPQVPTNMAAGTARDPLAGLTGARYAGMTNLPSADMFGPDGGMVGSMMDEDQIANMLSNPHVAQQMNEMLNNDQFLDMMVQQNPMLRNNPNAREILRSPMFRHMLTNPDALRNAARMQRMMRNVYGGGQNAFPAPGVTDNTPGGDSTTRGSSNPASATGSQPNPFDPASWAGLQVPGGASGNAANPFAAMLNPFGMGQQSAQGTQGAATTGPNTSTSGAGTPGTQPPTNTSDTNMQSNTTTGQGASPSSPPPNPFASLFGAAGGAGTGAGTNPWGLPPMSPEALQQAMQYLGMGSPSGSPAPPDNRPPEERYAEQLRQLNDMGFYDFDRNVAALRRSGGSVQGAIEHLLNSP